jgi:hypothetical protein
MRDLLNEWRNFLNRDLLNEISIKRFQENYPQFDTSKFSPQLRGNTDYLDIISNSIKAGENHNPDDYIQQFEFFKNSIEPNIDDEEFLKVSVPGDDDVSLVGRIKRGLCLATYNEIQQFQQARMYVLGKGSKRNLNSAYVSSLSEANERDFELIVEDDKWIVFYPKTIKGSITLARAYWDGSKVSYDETFNPSKGFGKNTGKISWCTSVSGGGNMFNNYHRQLNLHMYYCINKSPSGLEDPARKLCISFAKQSGKVTFQGGSASVDGDNNEINEEKARSYVGDILTKLTEDASQEKRLEIDVESYYASISFEQYLTMRAANEQNIDDFAQEFQQIVKYSKDAEKISMHALREDDSLVMRSFAESFVASNENTSPELLADIAYNGSGKAKAVAAINPNTPLEAAMHVVNSSGDQGRSTIAKNPKTPPAVLSQLSKDTSLTPLLFLVRNPNVPQEDLLRLAKGDNDIIKSKLASNTNLGIEAIEVLYGLEDESINLSLAKNPNTPQEILTNLSKHASMNVQTGVATNPNASPDILSDIAISGHEKAKAAVAKNPKTPTETLTKLSRHPSMNVLAGVAANPNTSPEVLTMFAKTGDHKLIKGIAGNTNTPYKILASLAQYGPSDAKELVSRNPTYTSQNESNLKNYIRLLVLESYAR